MREKKGEETMIKIQKRGHSIFFAILILLNGSIPVFAMERIPNAIERASEYIETTVTDPTIGSVGGEWSVIGLARSGVEVPQSYWDKYYARVVSQVESKQGILHDKKYTEYSRVILSLTAIGADPRDVGGYNLLEPLADFEKTIWQGINGPIWALIALDSGSYEIPVDDTVPIQATRESYINEILCRQLNNGGFSFTQKGGNGIGDVDITGMALQALAPYQEQEKVSHAVKQAVTYLSSIQNKDGGYTGRSGASSLESIVQVVVGLTALGIEVDAEAFIKEEGSLLDALFSFQKSNGEFLHVKNHNSSDIMASEQGLYGLVSVKRGNEGDYTLYNMGDVTKPMTKDIEEAKGKLEIENKIPVFSDIQGHMNEDAIIDMEQKGILGGTGDGKFAPNLPMTRAEFCVVICKALDLEGIDKDIFSDVNPTSWYAPFVAAAYKADIINGVGAGRFDPDGMITKEECAVLIMKSAEYMDRKIEMETFEMRNVLAQFGDYKSISPWAEQAMAFCYREGILEDHELLVSPKTQGTRGEISQMVYELLQLS